MYSSHVRRKKMDAVELLKEINKICENCLDCGKCPLIDWCNENLYSLSKDPKKVIEVVEKWITEHPKKTRQAKFLELHPKTAVLGGVINIKPCYIDKYYHPRQNRCVVDCYLCRKEYWFTEVE